MGSFIASKYQGDPRTKNQHKISLIETGTVITDMSYGTMAKKTNLESLSEWKTL